MFGCVFLILFSSSMQCGVLMIFLVSRLFWLKFIQFGGVLIRWLIECGFMYLDMLKWISLMFSCSVSCLVILVLLILVGLVNRKLLIGFFGLFRFEWVSLIVEDSVLMVGFCLKIIIFRLCFRCCSIFLLVVLICLVGMCVILVMIVFIFLMLISFLCCFFGSRCWWVLVLLIMLMVLFGSRWLLMCFIDRFIVVCSVLFEQVMLWCSLYLDFRFCRILQVLFMVGLMILIFWKWWVSVWFFLKMSWYFWKVVELMQCSLLEVSVGLIRLDVFMVLFDVELVLMMVWILLMNSIVLGIFFSVVNIFFSCFLKLSWYLVLVISVFRLSEQIIVLVSMLGIEFLMMWWVRFLVMVVLFMLVLFMYSGLFLWWWYRIWMVCLILLL